MLAYLLFLFRCYSQPNLEQMSPNNVYTYSRVSRLILNPAQSVVDVEEGCAFCCSSLRKLHEVVEHMLKVICPGKKL
jgi:hypothetical protein